MSAAIKAVEGVKDAKVLLAEKCAIVTYDPARVEPAALAKAIREGGYEPGEPSVASAPAGEPAVKN